MNIPPKKIVVVGSANVDLVTRVPRSARPGETILGRSFATVMGGKGANQAVAAARLGAAVTFIGCVGDDAFGAMQRAGLSAEGINTVHLKTHPTEPTGTAVILVADDGQNTIIVTPAANYGLTPADIAALDGVIAGADAVLLQLEIPIDTVAAVLDTARRHGVLSVLDAGPAQAVAPEILEKADIVSPNETEAEALTGLVVDEMEMAHGAAQRLRKFGVREVVLKLGARGALYVGEGARHVPAFPVKAVDTTAAGDAFTAALTLAWNAVPRADALRFAGAAGALATTVHGAQPSMPARAAVETFLKEHA